MQVGSSSPATYLIHLYKEEIPIANLTFKQNDFSPLILLIAFVLFEGPIRMTMATDPWLVDGSHWYFVQPLRLVLEALFVLSAGAVLWLAGNRALFVHKIKIEQLVYVGLGFALITGLFAFARLELWPPLLAPTIIGTTALWFVTGALIGIGQELTFRGLLLAGLQAYLSRTWVWIISIFIFVIAPLHSYRLFIYWQDGRDERAIFLAVVYLIAGILFTWLRLRTKSLIVPGLIHGLANAMTFATTFTLLATS